MLKDVEIASQIALSHFLDLRVTAAARDQLVEQTQWGHGEDDYSSVLRKYLYEPAPASYEEPQPEEWHEQASSGVDEPINHSAKPETQNLAPQEASIVGSQKSLPNFSGAVSAAAPATPPVRRGLLKQLLSRFSSGQE
jgi:hypothetical protein